MTTAAIIQARMSSRRFPGKMLAELGGAPLIAVVCRRVALAARVDAVVVATSTDPSDDALAAAVTAAGHRVHRGSLDDVLARFAGAARGVGADTVVRVTGDCPCVDPAVVDELIARLRAEGADYAANVIPPTWPDGLDVEVLTMAALERIEREASAPHDREHVTTFARARPGAFRQAALPNPRGDQSALLWSIDSPGDLELMRRLWAASGVAEPRLDDLLRVIERDPALRAASTASRHRNEGSIRSLRADLERGGPAPRIAASNALWERARDLIPAGTQTLSKGPTQFIRGFAPKYLARGKGCRVWDVDGNEFIDYPLGLGPVTLGHAHPEVTAAVVRVLEQGNCLSLMHPLEIELAERVRSMVPCAEMVRFGKNGSDATSACIRAARARTGRTAIARHGYHGWQDWSIESTYGVRSKGVPAEVMAQATAFPYNDLAALEQVLSARPCAAVIMEPVNLTPPAPGYLQGVRDLATRFGAVLVFDEVITGFRYARGGAQEHFGVIPDLTAMGKGMANGLPLSIVAGRREFMAPFEEIFFSFTFGGEASALAAALATLAVMEREDYWGHVWRQGARLQDGYRALAREFGLEATTDCKGLPPWTIVTFADLGRWSGLQLKTLFQQEMIRRGILFSGSQFLSLAHGDAEIDATIAAYREAMRVLRAALDLDAVDAVTCGEVNEVIFRRG